MKTRSRIAVVGAGVALMLLMDVRVLQLVPDAEAVAGVRRRTARRTAVVVGSAASAETASAQQQAAASQQQAQAAQQQAAASQQQAAQAEAEADAAKQQAAASQAQAEAYKQEAEAAGPLPTGTVVTALPDGCSTTTSGGVQYYQCGQNYFRAAFQGNQLVYVTAAPPQS